MQAKHAKGRQNSKEDSVDDPLIQVFHLLSLAFAGTHLVREIRPAKHAKTRQQIRERIRRMTSSFKLRIFFRVFRGHSGNIPAISGTGH